MSASSKEIVSWVLIAILMVVLFKLLWGFIKFLAIVIVAVFLVGLIFRVRAWGQGK